MKSSKKVRSHSRNSTLKIFLLLTIMCLNISSIWAQNASEYLFKASSRTYTAITGGTIISDVATDNNQFFNNQNIGFNFNYLGNDYTQFGISLNGFITMGTGGSTSTTPISGQNLTISVLGTNIAAQTGAVLRMQTVGTAPNRVCIIQWAGYRYTGQTGNYNFQIRLYETTNKIEFHYGIFSHEGTNRTCQVGIRGANDTDFNNRSLTNNVVWNTTNTTTGTANNSSLRLRSNAYPGNGLVFAYFPPRTDLGLNTWVNKSNPCLGDDLSYSVQVTSYGPADVANVSVLSEVPAGFTLQGSEASNGSYNSGTGEWTVGSLQDGETATLTFSLTVNTDQGGNELTFSPSISGASMIDPITSNNSSSVSVNVVNNSLPAISSIADLSVGYNQVSMPIDFTISDAESNPEDLIVAFSSSNTTCIPLSGIEISGTGTNRTLQITPGLNQFGNSTITIEVSDGVCSSSMSFNVEVFKQTYSNFESAKVVVGQVDFNTITTTASQVVAPGSNSSAVSAKGMLAVGSQTQNRVLLWNSVPTSNGEPADLVLGQTNFTNNGAGTSASALSSPDGVVFSPDGNKLIVADAGNNRLLIWNTIPTYNNQPADVVVGQTNFTNDGAGTAANRFNRPTDVLITPDGKMVVTDRNNHRVLIFNSIPTSNNASADVVVGQTNFTNNTSATTQSRLNTPWNTSLAPDGRFLIADDLNNRVLVFNQIPTTNGASADVVVGQADFTTGTAGNTANRFNGPGVTVSPSGVMAVADFLNHRVLIFNEIPTVNNADADIVLGQADFTQNVSFNNGSGVTGDPSDKNMSQPYGINFDLNERLFLNGRNMHRMMVFGQTPDQIADLALSFESNNGNPCVGGLVSYTITVTNNGPVNATNVVITSALPSGFTPVSSNVSDGTYNMNSGFWTIPYIGNGESVSLEMIGSVNLGENLNSITAYASVRSYNQVDNDFSNNAGSVTVIVEDNMAPTISSIADVIVDYNTPTSALEFTVDDTETDVGSLTVVAHSSNTTIIPNANIIISGTGASRSVTITPAADQYGTVKVTLTVQDGLCSTSTEFNVSVGNVWLGYSNDWSAASNWSTSLPTSSIGAYIPLSPIGGNYPVINAEVTVNNLGIQSGAMITVNATRTLTITGNFYNDGSQSTGNGIINMAGAAAQTFRGLAGSLTINNPSGITLDGPTTVQGVLTLTSGNLNVGSQTLAIRNPLAGNTANLITNANSTLVVEGTTAGIALPAQVNELAQLTLNNASGVNINADLTVHNLLELTSGNLRLNGYSLTLAGTISSVAGSIEGNVNSNITVSGNGNAGTMRISTANNLFNNFTLNRTGGSIIIENTLRIGGTLNLIEGLVTTGTDAVWLENNDPAAITSHGSNAYIFGNLRRCVQAGNSYDFPVGSSAYYQLATITFTSISDATCIDAGFTQGHTGSGPTDLSSGGNSVDGLLDHGFWTIKPTNTSSTINYNITLTSRGHNNGGPSADYHTVVKRADASANWQLLGDYSTDHLSGNDANPITVSRTNLTGFSDFAVGVSSNGSLPVELLSFKVDIQNNKALLTWQTASENNNDYFQLEKSSNGNDFVPISKIKGNGTSYSLQNYAYLDQSENKGMVYYRLKQVDYDGQFTYSPVINIYISFMESLVNIYPNPASPLSDIHFTVPSLKEDESVKIEIFNMVGNRVFEWAGTTRELEQNDFSLPFANAGTYMVTINTAYEKVVRKLMIK